MTSTSRLVYDERLTAPKAWWAIAVLFGLSLALIFLPYGTIAALIALSIGTCLAGMYVSAQGSAPDDSTPYLYLSTRTPHRLAEAIGARA
ncbi:DUF3093 family protein [Streptomyces sp. NBC_01373]|uniref:DUF3093 family protein n=1 Tax=Streptomyces sp. NBC_01373 TaxID=2903843 RepID=UPI002251D2D5|nr:DUF3093 family protein [Streptomyces sp. NBC_01373]MCX4706836.1 DUF3093 domain-containing protein [Streptomyces sp. NBC_01373]